MKTRLWGIVFLIVGAAICVLGMWQLGQPATYRATAKLKIENDLADITSQFTDGPAESGHDPNYLKTELEVIKSQLVLGKVVDAMDLNKRFGKIYRGGCPLRPAESVRHLKDRMDLWRVPNTKIVEIRMVEQDPVVAAGLANAVACAYIDFRLSQLRERHLRGIQALEQALREADLKIQVKRNEFVESKNQAADAEGELEELLKFRKSISEKIEYEKMNEPLKVSYVQVIDKAEPSSVPIHPTRPLGAVATLIGLGLAGFGALTLFQHKP